LKNELNAQFISTEMYFLILIDGMKGKSVLRMKHNIKDGW